MKGLFFFLILVWIAGAATAQSTGTPVPTQGPSSAGPRWVFGKSLFQQASDSEIRYPVNIAGYKFARPVCYYLGISLPNAGTGLVFDGAVELEKDTFESEVDLRAGRYKGVAKFEKDSFAGPVDFTYSSFEQDAFFDYCTFKDYAYFDRVGFKGHADFSNAVFGHVAFFSGMILSNPSELSFTLATLPDTLDLSDNTTIFQPVELTDASFIPSRVHRIFLNRTNISMIHMDYIHFKLLFRDPKYDNRPELTQEEEAAIYEELLNNFKARGQSDSYERLDVEYHQWQWDKTLIHSLIPWLPDIQMIWWYYGYRKWLVFVWAIFFLLLFSGINYFRLNDLNRDVYPMSTIPIFPTLGTLPFLWQRARWRLWYAVVYSATLFFTLTIKAEDIRFNRIGASLYIFIIYLSGIVCLAYMANFVLQK